jgi:hypothetical protein
MLRRKFLVTTIATGCTGAILASASALADSRRPFFFFPIDSSAAAADWTPNAPFKIPFGYEQVLISGEGALNIYDAGRDDWHDMNTVNETGGQVGRYLYRTHEVRSGTEYGAQPNGAVSVVDLKTGETRILAQDPTYDALDGIRWTPWGTILFAEEIDGGRLLEIRLDPNDPSTATGVVDRPALGRLAHEGIDVGPDGEVYVVDEHRGRTEGCAIGTPCGGGIYKFVPTTPGDLSAGELFALKVTGPDGTGQGEWVGPINPATARQSGSESGGESYQRPEDLEIVGNTLYVAITEGPRDVEGELYDGRVIAIDLDTLVVTDFVKAGVNVPVEIGQPGSANFQTGFDNVDNLAESPDGRLVLVEDNVPSDIWFASTRTNEFGASRNVELFASLSDYGAEGTGIYFSPKNPTTLYVNIQHSKEPDGDGTWAIRRKQGRARD